MSNKHIFALINNELVDVYKNFKIDNVQQFTLAIHPNTYDELIIDDIKEFDKKVKKPKDKDKTKINNNKYDKNYDELDDINSDLIQYSGITSSSINLLLSDKNKDKDK